MENNESKISVVINTYNASQHLQQVLDSVKGFDEVVVCDMESTDNTREIAEKNGCKIVIFPKGEHKICEPARDFAIHSATYPWVFVVDADELVPDALREYLYDAIRTPDFDGALAVARVNLFMGKPLRDTPDYQLRFFRHAKAYWPPIIHARPQIEGEISKIPARKELSLQHLDNPTVKQRIDKLNNYTDYEVPKRAHKNYSAAKMLFRPVWFFLKSYLIGGGFLEGKRGIVKAYMNATYQMTLLAKIIENQNKNEQSE